MTQPTGFQDGDWREVRRLLEFLLARVLDTGGQSVGLRFGTGAVAFTASAHSANATITHGLGRVPQVVTFGVYNDIVVEIVSKGATSFVVQGWAPGGAITASLAFDWTVIG